MDIETETLKAGFIQNITKKFSHQLTGQCNYEATRVMSMIPAEMETFPF